MTNLLRSICILFLASIPLVQAEVEPPKQKLFRAAEADKEIHAFMTQRWHRQAWQIEHKSIEGLSDASPMWHVKGTNWWVRLDGPEYLKGRLNLSELDTSQIYEFTGVAVDQNYGVITFYVLSKPEKVAVPKKNKKAEPDGSGQ